MDNPSGLLGTVARPPNLQTIQPLELQQSREIMKLALSFNKVKPSVEKAFHRLNLASFHGLYGEFYWSTVWPSTGVLCCLCIFVCLDSLCFLTLSNFIELHPLVSVLISIEASTPLTEHHAVIMVVLKPRASLRPVAVKASSFGGRCCRIVACHQFILQGPC